MTPSVSAPQSEAPPGFRVEAELSARPGVRVVRAVRDDGSRVALRLEAGPAGREGLAELAVLAAVDHPGLARLVDHGALSGGGRYLAREWIPGEDLAAWSRSSRPERIGAVAAELCEALDHLHRTGFVHADLKAENVIVTPEGRPVLCDFGLARPRREGDLVEEVGGTLFALAPEILLGAAPTPRSDLFALGAMLHRLLIGRRLPAREFYGRFPAQSFFDAAGTPPEELPTWARDVVASLVTREPERRPESAAAVGRALRSRLGGEHRGAERATELRWPVGQGREAWLSGWFRSMQSEPVTERPFTPEWIRVPRGETPGATSEALRLFASLRGRNSREVDAARELSRIEHAAALDAWVQGLADETAGSWLFATTGRADPWIERGLACLARACTQRTGARTAFPRLIVVADFDPPASDVDWAIEELPPVEDAHVERFLAARLPEEESERLRAFARLLHAVSGGSATRVDGLLRQALRQGWILGSGGSLRLRPGPLPSSLSLEIDTARTSDLDVLSDAARGALAALEVCGGRATTEEVREVLDVEDRTLAAALLELSAAGLTGLSAGAGRMEVLVTGGTGVLSTLSEERVRDLHRARAALLEREGVERWRILPHRWRARPGDETVAEVLAELAELDDRGCPELGLELIDGIERHAQELGIDPADAFPRLLAERAGCWARLRQPGHALASIEPLVGSDEPRVQSLVALVRAQVARLCDETDEALEQYDRALALDPELYPDAYAGKVDFLHSTGRDEEVVSLVADPDAPPLTRRQRAYVASLAAVSAFRLGRVEEALAKTNELIAEAAQVGDVGREAALHLVLATIERRTGSMERALRELERSCALYDRSGSIAGLAHVQSTMGGVLREQGDMLAAEPLLASAMEIRERLGNQEGADTVRGVLGLLHAERGHAVAAIEVLERTAERMGGAQRIRFAPLLRARAAEMRARIGREPPEETDADEEADPRAFLARCRRAWLLGDTGAAAEVARRAESLARPLKLQAVVDEARFLAAMLARQRGESDAALPSSTASLVAEDVGIVRLLETRIGDFDTGAAEELAEALSSRGRDDRAARMWIALSARSPDVERAAVFAKRGEECLERCTAGLTDGEAKALRTNLLGLPDPWPGDLTRRPELSHSKEEFEMEVVSLLDINRQLVEEQDLSNLLGVIVDHALSVTGGERGFLILEEDGELRFDTALDSRRGDIAQPDFEVSRSVVSEALERMRPVRVSNAVDDPLLGHTPSVVSLELRSILCTPFRVSANLRGAIYVDHRLRTGAFNESAERLCLLLADQAALAILQIRRLVEIRDLNKRLEGRVIQQETDLRAARKALQEAGVPATSASLVGSSPKMMQVRELIERVAPSELSVLVLGPSGTGKELAARALHDHSPRADRPFVSENCAALPPTLIESELFGYRRGAFTGADEDREGLFERVDGGTLFLDEISEMPHDLQAKLLRVLETNEVRRLGDSNAREVDFRLVAATNRDPMREVAENRFRQDLFYRLDGVRIQMPPLSERTQDIPELVAHFLRLEEARDGLPRRVSRDVLALLCRRAWPGNVRELRNEIARLVVISEGDLNDPDLVREPGAEAREGREKPRALAEIEREVILEALEFTGGDKPAAAALLGISRAKIYQRLKEWSEEDRRFKPRAGRGR